MTYEVKVYVGDNILVQSDDPAQSAYHSADAREVFAAIGQKLSEAMSGLRPDQVAFSKSVNADAIDLEIGFSFEVSAGGVLNLFLSPKAGGTCKAKLTWKRPSEATSPKESH